MTSDPYVAAVEAHYEWVDAWDRAEAARFDEQETRREITPRRVTCGKCGWYGSVSTHYLNNDRQPVVRACPMCHRKNPDWRLGYPWESKTS